MSLYRFGKAIVSAVLKPAFQIKVKGAENVPSSGPVLICSNHISNFDPPVVGVSCPRDIAFMGKQELFTFKPFGFLLKKLNVFPVKRGMQDRSALRVGLDLLSSGKTLGLFPEGTRSKTGELGEPLSGVGFFAVRSEAAVVPCAIIGTYKKGKPLTVVYGKPIDMEAMRREKASAKEVAKKIMTEIQFLIDEHEA